MKGRFRFFWRREAPADTWAARPFFDGTWITIFSVPGLKCRFIELEPNVYQRHYVIEEGWDLEHTPPPSTEQDIAIQTFAEMLRAATSDGGRKRAAGLKPPWWRDPVHEPAIFSHLAKWKRGERHDPDSGAHPLVHAACRMLMIAYQETYGCVDPPERSVSTHHGHGVSVDTGIRSPAESITTQGI